MSLHSVAVVTEICPFRYARLVVTSHSCESAHKWSMEPLQRDSRKDMEPRPNGMMGEDG